MALLDHLRVDGNAPLLIETDTSALDLWKAYTGDVEGQWIDLEQRDGGLELLEVLGIVRDRHRSCSGASTDVSARKVDS